MSAAHLRAFRSVGRGALLLGALVLLCGSAYERVVRARARHEFPVPGRLVNVGDGRRLHLDCRGRGAPTVVLEAGLDVLGALSWTLVHDVIARTTRVCAYSRAGIMWSAPGHAYFDSRGAARDLRLALQAAGEAPPYVLVGHSIGAMHALRFAADNPAAVVGLVFVDPSHPDQFTEMRRATGRSLEPTSGAVRLGARLAFTGALRLLPRSEPQNWPPHVSAASAAFLPTSLASAAAELDAVLTTLADARTVRDLGDRPIIVLGAADEPSVGMLAQLGLSANDRRRLQAVRRRLHRDLASFSSRGQYRLIERSSHYVQMDRPDAVVDAVAQVVQEVRSVRRD